MKQDLSKLPSGDPRHVCGVYCDGQDGRNSKCATERRAAKKNLVEVGDAYHNCPFCGWMGAKPCSAHAVNKVKKPKKIRSGSRAYYEQREKLIEEIEAKLLPLECKLCGTNMGYYEGKKKPSAICSRPCVSIHAHRTVLGQPSVGGA
jgi:hypothetical protein